MILPNLETAAPEIAAIGNPIGAVTETVATVIQDALASDAKAIAARKLATGERNKTFSVREAIMLSIGAASAKRGWTAAEIESGVEAGCTAHTTREGKKAMKPQSLKQLKSFMKHAARCGAETKALNGTATTMWADEDADKEGEKPLKRAYKREIFFFDRLLQDHLGGKPMNADAILDRARAADPKFNAKLAAAKVKSMVAAIRAVYAQFPIEDLALAASTFEAITETELHAAWDKRVTDIGSAEEPETDDEPEPQPVELDDALGRISRAA